MGTSNPRPRGNPSLSGELQKARADREQIRRLLSRTPKAAPAALGGGIVGVAEVRAQAASLYTSGASKIQEGGVIYNAPTDPLAGQTGWEPADDVSAWCTVSGNEITLDQGWYDITVSCEIGWADTTHSPDSFYALIYTYTPRPLFTNTQPIYFPAVSNGSTVAPKRGFSAHMAWGATYANGPLSFELRWGSYSGGADALTGVYEPDPYLVWTIRRYG